MKIIRKYISQICTITFIMMMLAFMVFMTRVNIRHDQTPAIDDNARLETPLELYLQIMPMFHKGRLQSNVEITILSVSTD